MSENNQIKYNLPALKLAGFYLGILVLASFFYSAIIYSTSSQSIEQGLRRPAEKRQSQNLGSDLRGLLLEIDSANREEIISATKKELIRRLIIMNIIIWTAGGVTAYYFARKTLEPIEDAGRKLEQFTADAAHELRTPLSAMRLENELFLDGEKQSIKEAKKLAKSNIEEIDLLTRLSEDLLALTRGMDGGSIESISISKSLENAINTLEPLAKSKNIKIKYTPKELGAIDADASEIKRLFMIVIDNAIKYSHKNSEVSVDTKISKSGNEIIVSDNGVGIPKDELSKVFERFYRSDKSRTEEGFGLGLPIASQIANKYRGSIDIKSQNNKGTKVTIKL